MTQTLAISVMKKALIIGFKISMPFLIISMIIGVVISILQAVTHLNDQSLTFVPKVVVIGIMGIFLAPFIIKQMNILTALLYEIIEKIVTG